MGQVNSEFSTWDLFTEIEKGNFPSWTWYVQVMPEKEAENYRFDVFDVTKVWPHSDYPLIPVGKMTLNRNPENYHAETEQAAFSPSHLVPGIEPSNDKMLQGRLLNYPDTHRHRLGPNYDQIPINCPYRARMGNYNNRDGPMQVAGGYGPVANYEPSMHGTSVSAGKAYAWAGETFNGQTVGRYESQHPNNDYEQPRALWNNVFTDADRDAVVENIGGFLGKCNQDIKERQCRLFYKVDPVYGERVAKAVGVSLDQARL